MAAATTSVTRQAPRPTGTAHKEPAQQQEAGVAHVPSGSYHKEEVTADAACGQTEEVAEGGQRTKLGKRVVDGGDEYQDDEPESGEEKGDEPGRM